MTFTWIDGAIPKPYRFTGWVRKDEQTKLSLGVHTPHGGWWGSHLVQGRVGTFLRLWSQSLGKATRPREQDCGEAAGCLQGTRRLPRLDWHGRYRDGIYSRWPGFASSTHQDSRGPGGNNASHRNTVSRFASHQIHSEVNLDMASLTQSGGAWPGGAHFCPPPSSCLSRLPWEVASESQILGFTVISLKNKNENIRFFF